MEGPAGEKGKSAQGSRRRGELSGEKKEHTGNRVDVNTLNYGGGARLLGTNVL